MEYRLNGYTILIVDDDLDILESIELAIRAEGAKTLMANNGTDAVKENKIAKPDAIILDMMLPKRSGFLVIEEIMKSKKTPVIVMLTANQGKRHMAYAKSLGVSEYFYKPIGLDRLIDRISNLLSERIK